MALACFAFATIVMGQIAGFLGWGEYFPWSTPTLLSGAAGEQAGNLEPVSYAIVLLTSVASVVALIVWWQRADQSR